MNSKSRITAVFALLAAVALFTVGVILPKVVSEDKPIPLDLTATTITLTDPAATVGQGYQIGADNPQALLAPVNRQFNIALNQPATETTASARVGVTTARGDLGDDLESLLSAEVWTFTVNRLTGETEGTAKVSDTPATPPVEMPIDGLWAKFPQHTEQHSYDYFDATLRKSIPAEFQGTINQSDSHGNDVELYVFRQEIEPTNVAELYAGVRNRTNVDKEGKQVEGFLHHGGWRELQVEPRSGLIISVEEEISDVYVSAEGEELEELLRFHGKTQQSTQDAMMKQAMDTFEERGINKVGVALMVVGAIVAAVSLLVALWPRRRRAGLDN